jgi:RimJ/RimL family protein N-acetyltransferase
MTEGAPAADVWDTVRLTPIAPGDIDRLNAWQNDPEVRDLTMGFRGPVLRQTTAEWIQTIIETNLKSRVVFAIRVGGAIQGVVQLHSIDWVQRSALLGVYVGDPSARGSGLGAAATALILDYGFNGLDLQRVWLEVLSTNLAAKRVYERLGFAHEGRLRSAYFLGGQRIDVDVYGLLQAEWTGGLPPNAHRLAPPRAS